jgi:hypothetical protein
MRKEHNEEFVDLHPPNITHIIKSRGLGAYGWLMHCATTRKIAGSVSDRIFEIFCFAATVALRLNQLGVGEFVVVMAAGVYG